MLYELYVENIALIRELRLSLGPGMNALTGETGAGKSLIIDAMSLLLGGRGGDSLIRDGADKALVEGVFLPPFPAAAAALLETAAEDSLILSRELIRGGRSLSRLNGRVVTLSRLREVGRLLINIHGQHEHTLLAEEEQQRILLDSFGGPPCLEAADETRRAYQQLRSAEEQARDFEQNRQDREERRAELTAIILELEGAELKPGEDEQLREESRLLSCGEKLYDYSHSAHQALYEGAMDRLNQAATQLRQAAELDGKALPLAERLSSLYYEAEDAAAEIAAYRDQVDLDAYRLEAVEARLAKLGRLGKKYGGDADFLLERLAAARQELAQVEEMDLTSREVEENLTQAREEYQRRANTLTNARMAAGAELGRAVTAELRLLAMSQACFQVDLPLTQPGALGQERVCFMISPNKGEALQPVNRIASGGELSRVILAIKVILARLDQVPTLIFDEVDTGMSGRALTSVAQRLALVSHHAQTICVSHGAVLAAAAGQHILIEKHEEAGRTIIASHVLDHEQRLEELSRMIAGAAAGPTTRRQAEELLEHMQKSSEEVKK